MFFVFISENYMQVCVAALIIDWNKKTSAFCTLVFSLIT